MAIRQLSTDAVSLIKSYEGIRDGDPTTPTIDPYMDPIGIWTIGWGHAIRFQGRFLKGTSDMALVKSLYPDGLSKDQCEALLVADLMNFCRDVSQLLTIITSDNQFGALVSFAFNVGVGNLKTSTLLRYHNSSNFKAAAGEFLRWNKAGGKILDGLTRRRHAESELYLKPT